MSLSLRMTISRDPMAPALFIASYAMPAEIARHRHPQAGGNRGRGMAGTEDVVFALGTFGEAREPAALAQRPDAGAPSGQDLVRISLMADVPDEPVSGRVEHIVQRDGEFDDA